MQSRALVKGVLGEVGWGKGGKERKKGRGRGRAEREGGKKGGRRQGKEKWRGRRNDIRRTTDNVIPNSMATSEGSRRVGPIKVIIHTHVEPLVMY